MAQSSSSKVVKSELFQDEFLLLLEVDGLGETVVFDNTCLAAAGLSNNTDFID